MSQHKKPCATCPFRRSIEPGALGGSPPHVYVGQTEGGFMIPCHEVIDYTDPEWKEGARTLIDHQCAGAAIYRANNGLPSPSRILELPEDKEMVFGSHVEFVAHHCKIPKFVAAQALKEVTPAMCLESEKKRAGCKVTLIPK